jgi:hypothetical protein
VADMTLPAPIIELIALAPITLRLLVVLIALPTPGFGFRPLAAGCFLALLIGSLRS